MTAREEVASLREALTTQREQLVAVQSAHLRLLASNSELTARLARVEAALDAPGEPGGPPAPDGPVIPEGANAVRIGDAVFPLAGINPTRPDFPGGRGPDELVLYRAPVTHTVTNIFGTEVMVLAGRIVEVVDREPPKQTQGIIVPATGYVLSGNRKARQWLNAHAVRGAVVEVVRLDAVPEPPVTPPTGGGPVASGRRTVALYLKDGSGRGGDIPADVNQVRIAFAQGDPPKFTEWGGESTADTIRGLNAWRSGAPGRQVLVSVGGAGGRVNVGNRAAFVAGIRAMETQLGLQMDGWDVDIEGSALPVADVVAVSVALAEGRRDSWVTTFVPPGGPPVAQYLAAAKACQSAGLRVQFGQQLYDAPVDEAATLRQTRLAVDALGAGNVLIGMMIGSGPRHWTLETCVSRMRAVLREWPLIGGAYLWSEKYTEDDEWARRMAAALGQG